MKRVLVTVAVAASAAVLVGAASGDAWQPLAAVPNEPVAAAPEKTKLKLKRSPYGRVLFSGGYAVYLFTRDGESSECYGRCAEAWPPLIARGELVAGRGIKKRLLGRTSRDNGKRQVTYDGHPLYGYVDDPRGEVLWHDVEEFGGTWYAVRKTGRPAP
jgi:predicted lipoprotein with Yx(FWY)xxD motif